MQITINGRGDFISCIFFSVYLLDLIEMKTGKLTKNLRDVKLSLIVIQLQFIVLNHYTTEAVVIPARRSGGRMPQKPPPFHSTTANQ